MGLHMSIAGSHGAPTSDMKLTPGIKRIVTRDNCNLKGPGGVFGGSLMNTRGSSTSGDSEVLTQVHLPHARFTVYALGVVWAT